MRRSIAIFALIWSTEAGAQVVSAVQVNPLKRDVSTARSALEERIKAILDSATVALGDAKLELLARAALLVQETERVACDGVLNHEFVDPKKPKPKWASRSYGGFHFVSPSQSSVSDCLALTYGAGVLGLASLTRSDDVASAFVEVVSAAFGALRFTVGSAIAKGNDEDNPANQTETAVQRLLSGGGVLSVRAEYPLSYARNKRMSFAGMLTGHSAVDIPSLGADVAQRTSNIAGGAVATFQVSSNDQSVQAFGQLRYQSVRGSRTFELETFPGVLPGRSLRYGQVSYGLLINKLITVNVSRVFAGSNVLQGLGTQISISARNPKS